MVLVKNDERQKQKNVDKNIVLLDKIDWAKKNLMIRKINYCKLFDSKKR